MTIDELEKLKKLAALANAELWLFVEVRKWEIDATDYAANQGTEVLAAVEHLLEDLDRRLNPQPSHVDQRQELKNKVAELELKCRRLEKARDDWRESARNATEALGTLPEQLDAMDKTLDRERELGDKWFHKAQDLEEAIADITTERDFYRHQIERVAEWAGCQAEEYADLNPGQIDHDLGWAPCYGGSKELEEILADGPWDVPEDEAGEVADAGECPECKTDLSKYAHKMSCSQAEGRFRVSVEVKAQAQVIPPAALGGLEVADA